MDSEEGIFGFGLRLKSERKPVISARHLLTLKEFSKEEIFTLLAVAAEVKARPALFRRALEGRTLAMIFAKPSTRTRVSFEAAMSQLGGAAIFLSEDDLQLRRGETIADTAKVLSRYADAIVIRTFAQADVDDMAEASRVPVINGLTDDWHPCQVLADLLTIAEAKAPVSLLKRSKAVHELGPVFEGLKLAYVGDGNNMANTLIIGGAIVGMEVAVATPKGYEVGKKVIEEAKKKYGGRVAVTGDPAAAVKDADFIYTDVWASMGQDEDHDKRVKAFKGFQVNKELLKAAGKKKPQVLHCLPAHRGEEISAGIIDSEDTIIWDQAENRLHAQKALLIGLLLREIIDG